MRRSIIIMAYHECGDSQVALVVKNPPANAGDTGGLGSIPWLGNFPGIGHGNPFQYSFLLGESNGQRSLAGYNPWSHKELDTIDAA